MKWIAIISVLLAFSCSKNNVSPLTYEKPMLIIGNGGGFTGIATSYYIMEDGQVYRSGMSDTSFINVGRIDQKIINQQFDSYLKMGFNELDLNDPGNRYFYIAMKENGTEHKIQWGRSELQDQRLSIYHRNMMELIKKLDQVKE